jgi:quinolinate synthase
MLLIPVFLTVELAADLFFSVEEEEDILLMPDEQAMKKDAQQRKDMNKSFMAGFCKVFAAVAANE